MLQSQAEHVESRRDVQPDRRPNGTAVRSRYAVPAEKNKGQVRMPENSYFGERMRRQEECGVRRWGIMLIL